MNDGQIKKLIDELRSADPYDSVIKAQQLAELMPHIARERERDSREVFFAHRHDRDEALEHRHEARRLREHDHEITRRDHELARLDKLITARQIADTATDASSAALLRAAAEISSPAELQAAIKTITAVIDEAKQRVDTLAPLAEKSSVILTILEEVRARQVELEKLILSVKRDQERWREAIVAAFRTLTP